MSTIDEQARSLWQMRNLCYDLINCKATPRVPKAVRERARAVVKHFPLVFQHFIEELNNAPNKKGLYEQFKFLPRAKG